MTIQEAIEILRGTVCYLHPGSNLDEHDAIELGIEALKRVIACRPKENCLWENLLPGETEATNEAT